METENIQKHTSEIAKRIYERHKLGYCLWVWKQTEDCEEERFTCWCYSLIYNILSIWKFCVCVCVCVWVRVCVCVCLDREGEREKQYIFIRLAAAAAAAKLLQSCLTLCDPTDSSLPGSSTHGIFQARVLERVAIAFSAATIKIPQKERLGGLDNRNLFFIYLE